MVRRSSSPRVSFANARPRPTRLAATTPRLALGVGTPTLPPLMPTFVQDDGRFRFSAELFIVLRSAPRGDVRPPTLARLLSTQRALAEAEHHAREALADLFVGSIPRHGPIHSHAWR